MPSDLTRPIIGIQNRTAQEVFDIMCDRFRALPTITPAEVGGLVDAQTEARAIVSAILVDERLAVGYQIETLADAIVEHIATALAAKDAELATLHEADGNFWEAIARAERAEAQLAEITEGSRQEFAANMGPMRAYWLQTDHTRLMAENGNLRALLAEKNKALEPFARNVELIPLGAQDHDRLCDYGSQFNGTPTVGQARAARRALEAQGGDDVL